MNNKTFVKWFLITMSSFIVFIFIFNICIDPYNKYGINIFNIKYKLTRDDRGFKIGQINTIEKIDNLIIGSSRAQTLDPNILTKKLGGVSYNFGVGGGKIEDGLGLIFYLEKQNKLPKNILLALDFSSFNANNKVHTDFLNSKELNFLKNKTPVSEITHFLSIDTTRSAFKTLKAYMKNKKPKVLFNSSGLVIGDEKDTNFLEINNLSAKYFMINYSNGKFSIDFQRVNYFKEFVDFCILNNINLKIIMTPIYNYQFTLLQSNNELKDKYLDLIKILSEIYPFYNFMENTKYNGNINFFMDNVHYKKELGDLILFEIY